MKLAQKKIFAWTQVAKTNQIGNIFQISILLLLSIGANSCKKEVRLPIDKQNAPSAVKQDDISYPDFLNSININALGVLKSTLGINNPKDKLLSITGDRTLGLDIYTDVVKKFTLNNEVSYVFKMRIADDWASWVIARNIWRIAAII